MTVIMRIRHGVRGDRHGSAPMLIRDHLDDMRSMADGEVYSSKSAYYRSLKQQGLEIDDRPRIRDSNRPDYDADDLRADIGRAMAETLSPERAKQIETANADINGKE